MLAHIRFLFITSSLLLFYAFSCKTAEEIQQEKKVKQLDTEMKTTLETNASLVSRIKQLEDHLGNVTGKYEENDYEKRKLLFGELRKLQAKILVLEESNKSTQEQLDQIQANQKEQKAFIDKVLKSLSSLKGGKSSSKRTKKKRSDYDEAMWNYRKARYSTARKQLQPLLKKEKGNRLARIYHNLGMIAYMDKKYDDALIYFSKLYSEHAKSPYIANGLFFMGKTLQNKGKKEEAKEAWSELIKVYPKHKKAKDAKKIMSKI